MTKKLFAVNTQASRARVYVVEAETEEEAMQILADASKNAANDKTPRAALNATTSENIVAISETNLEDLKNGLDIANMIPNTSSLHQDNVSEDDLPSVIIRAGGSGFAPQVDTSTPFGKLVDDILKFVPNDGKLH